MFYMYSTYKILDKTNLKKLFQNIINSLKKHTATKQLSIQLNW